MLYNVENRYQVIDTCCPCDHGPPFIFFSFFFCESEIKNIYMRARACIRILPAAAINVELDRRSLTHFLIEDCGSWAWVATLNIDPSIQSTPSWKQRDGYTSLWFLEEHSNGKDCKENFQWDIALRTWHATLHSPWALDNAGKSWTCDLGSKPKLLAKLFN